MKNVILRGIAFYLDALIFSILTGLLFLLHHYFSGDLSEQLDNFRFFSSLIYHLISYSIYFGLSEYFFCATLGKKILGFQLELNKSNSSSLLVKILIRTFTRIIPINPISFMFNEDQVFWHERWSGIKTQKLTNHHL